MFKTQPNTWNYALKGVKLDAAAQDSVTIYSNYLLCGPARNFKTGFMNEAYTYINKSLDYNPNRSFQVSEGLHNHGPPIKI